MNRDISSVLVLGGKGFIGRHAVSALVAKGVHVVVGTRTPGRRADRVEEREFHLERMLRPEAWWDAVDEFDVVLNCVGILRPQWRASYEQIHHLAPYALTLAASTTRTRVVHISAIGLRAGDRSGFLNSKRRGEESIKTVAADWVLVRPSLLDGEGGFGARWLRGVSRLPFLVVPADARGRISALTVRDLGEALSRLCLGTAEELRLVDSREFELGGPESYDFKAYISGLRARYTGTGAAVVKVPGLMARSLAHLCDLIYFSPFSFGHWELLRRDNVPNPNRLSELLGREPTRVIAHVLD